MFQPVALPTRLSVAIPPGVRLVTDGVHLSPDGRTVAFSGAREGVTQVYLRSLDQSAAVPLRGTEGRSFFCRSRGA